MGEYPDFRTPEREQRGRSSDPIDEPLLQQGLQEIAHDRGRICKKRGCVVCAPLRELRQVKKKQRRAEAKALLHAKGRPCGGAGCALPVCVEARETAAAEAAAAAADVSRVEAHDSDRRHAESPIDPDRAQQLQAERHRVGLPCGSQDCLMKVCIDGFAKERTRRHRAGRPCRSTTCDNAICVSARSTS